jgi:hypothetical protein
MTKRGLTKDGYMFFCSIFNVKMSNDRALIAYGQYKATGIVPEWWTSYVDKRAGK